MAYIWHIFSMFCIQTTHHWQHKTGIFHSCKKCFGGIKHFRSSTPHTSLDGSRIIKAIQTQNKALINTPSSGFEVRLRLKYLLVYIVVQVIVSCELFSIDKIQTIATENRCGQKRRELPVDESICNFARFQFCSKNWYSFFLGHLENITCSNKSASQL